MFMSTAISLSARMCSFSTVDVKIKMFEKGCSKNTKAHYSKKTCKELSEYINRCSTATMTFGVKVEENGSVKVSSGKVIK